ncbi:TPA: triacylglycerol lipase, partial [Streptococcus suis]|nr:triacylglycerol lipase [Streptococcus suis]
MNNSKIKINLTDFDRQQVAYEEYTPYLKGDEVVITNFFDEEVSIGTV